jgi:hypothetical protein
MVPSVHMVMGVDEVSVISLALGLLNAKIDFDLERWEDKDEKDRKEFMSMLSLKFTTENMQEGIAEMFDGGMEYDNDSD